MLFKKTIKYGGGIAISLLLSFSIFKKPLLEKRPWNPFLEKFPSFKTYLHNFKQKSTFHFRNFFLKHAPKTEKPFVLGTLHAQLGNQLFEAAATIALAKRHHAEPIFPDLTEAMHSDIPFNYKHILWRLNASKPRFKVETYYKASSLYYEDIPYQPNMQIEGYFQSEKYFKEYAQDIIELFSPSREILHDLKERYSEIICHPQTVAVHVRTCFKEYPDGNGPLPFLGKTYFERAIAEFPQESLFVICSDHIDWCKTHLQNIAPHMIFIEEEPHYIDFYLMSLCKHQIISNSSFSWWAAYLNKNPDKKVIAPPIWFRSPLEPSAREIVAEGWIILNEMDELLKMR